MEPSIDYKFDISCSQARNALYTVNFFRTLLQTDGRNAWHSPQEPKAALGLQDLADRHHHILAVAVPYRQSYWMMPLFRLLIKLRVLRQLHESTG